MNGLRTTALRFFGIRAALVTALLSYAVGTNADGEVVVELNKLETAEDACRAFMVLENGSAASFSTLKLDLVVFDPAGIVARRIAVETAPLPAGKTMLKVFPIDGIDCASISRVLLNDVLACGDASGPRLDCLAALSTRAKPGLSFIK